MDGGAADRTCATGLDLAWTQRSDARRTSSVDTCRHYVIKACLGYRQITRSRRRRGGALAWPQSHQRMPERLERKVCSPDVNLVPPTLTAMAPFEDRKRDASREATRTSHFVLGPNDSDRQLFVLRVETFVGVSMNGRKSCTSEEKAGQKETAALVAPGYPVEMCNTGRCLRRGCR